MFFFFIAEGIHGAFGLRTPGFRHHHFGQQDGSGRGHDDRSEQVLGLDAAENIGAHDTAGDMRHAGRHDDHQLRFGHRRQKRTNGQRRFGLSHEDAGRDVERLHAAGAHQPGHDAGRDADDELHHAVVIKDGEERGNKNDGRQNLEGEIKAVFRVLDAQLAEDELRAGKRIAEQAIDGLSGHGQRAPAVFEFEHQKSEEDLQPESGDDGSAAGSPGDCWRTQTPSRAALRCR